MSPILVRPVREQLEHDRVIRLLQAKYRKKYDAGINPGAEQAAPVGAGASVMFPDLVLQTGRKLMGVIEVETSESVNHLEAMSQWASLGRLRVPFYLYVPASSIDTTRRLCADHQIPVAEIWTYSFMGDQPRFTQITRSAPLQVKAAVSRPEAARPRRPVTPAAKPRPRAAAKPAPRSRAAASKTKKAAKPVRAPRQSSGQAQKRK